LENYRFELITGPMSCGKTEELLRRLKRAKIANKSVKVFSPIIDTRAPKNHIQSRNGALLEAIKISDPYEIFDYLDGKEFEVIGIDEIQFFDSRIINVVQELNKINKKIIASGLDLDFKAEPFGSMPELLCIADRVDKLTAICMKCGSEYGNRTQRLINGKPADRNSPLIMIGGDESYEARCINCYEINDSQNKFEFSSVFLERTTI